MANFPFGVSVPTWDTGGDVDVSVTNGGATVQFLSGPGIEVATSQEVFPHMPGSAVPLSYVVRYDVTIQDAEAWSQVVAPNNFEIDQLYSHFFTGWAVGGNEANSFFKGWGIAEVASLTTLPLAAVDTIYPVVFGWDRATLTSRVEWQGVTYSQIATSDEANFYCNPTLMLRAGMNFPGTGDIALYDNIEVEILEAVGDQSSCGGEPGIVRGLYLQVCGEGPCCP